MTAHAAIGSNHLTLLGAEQFPVYVQAPLSQRMQGCLLGRIEYRIDHADADPGNIVLRDMKTPHPLAGVMFFAGAVDRITVMLLNVCMAHDDSLALFESCKNFQLTMQGACFKKMYYRNTIRISCRAKLLKHVLQCRSTNIISHHHFFLCS